MTELCIKCKHTEANHPFYDGVGNIKCENFVSEDELSLCNGCYCMTHSIRKGRAYFVCGKCGHNKTLGDFFQYESKLNSSKGSFTNNG